MPLDAVDLNPTDEAILDMLAEGRCTTAYVAAEHGYTRGNVGNELRRLAEHGHVERVHTGLYELVGDPRDAGGGGEGERVSEEWDRLDEAQGALEGTPADASNPAVENWAEKLGVTPDELAAEMRGWR